MFQILLFERTIASAFYGIIAGIFSTVAKIYDILLDLVNAPNEMFVIEFGNIVDAIYVAAGVFMLFRVMVSMIQMFLNPDLVSDSQAGAGKLLSRIVIAIALLILLRPTGFVLGDSGILNRIENAMIGSGGLINNIMDRIEYSNKDAKSTSEIDSGNVSSAVEEGANAVQEAADQAINNVQNNMSGISGYFIEDVYADTGDLSCYYFGISEHKGREVWTSSVEAGIIAGTGRVKDINHEITIDAVYKIDFFKSKNSANKGVGTPHQIGDTPYYYKVRSGTVIGGVERYGKYSSLDPNAMSAGTFKDGFPSECPKEIKLNTSGKSYSPRKNYVGHNGPTTCESKGGADSNGYKNCTSVGILGGYSSYAQMKKTLDDWKDNAKYGITGVDAAEAFVGQGKKKYDESAKNDAEYLGDLHHRNESLGFAQTVAGTFMECSGGDKDECNESKNEMFESSEANDTVIDYIADDTMTLDFFTGLVIGLALIVYLIILCVDVIVRRLKLLLLEMISPIPVISFVDPKDKMLNTWFKMYMSIYADLFIKLIALALLINLLSKDTLDALWGDSATLFVKFLYIVAILVFAKLVPSLISKVFGLEGMGGSFKDILGMGKAAAGFGAGAVLGGAVGAATGKGLGRLSGLTKGAMMGAGSGAKGNITGGAQGISARNARINDAKKNGLGFWQRTAAGIAGTVGYSPQTRMDNKIKNAVDKKEMLDNFRKHKDNIEGMADSSNYMSDLKVKMERGEITKDQFKQARSRFIEINEKGRKNEAGFYELQNADGSWSVARINVDGLDDSPIKYEKSAAGKISQAEAEMRAEFNSSHALQRELGMEGQSITDFKSFENAEGKAREKSNQYSTQIIEVQKSDKYGRAKAFEDYSKKS